MKCIALFLAVSYLIYKTIKNRRLCKFYLHNKRKIFFKKQRTTPINFLEDIHKDLLREPLYSFCDIIHANSTCYIFVQSEDDMRIALSNTNFNEITIKVICQKLNYSRQDMIIEDITINQVKQKVIAHKVIVDGFIVGILCFFFDDNKIFSNEELKFMKSFIELVKLVEKSDVIEDALGKCE